MKTFSSLQSKKHFTLIELLIVIAIIAILAGMLLPVLSGVKNHAKSVICKQQLRDFGMYTNYYTNDYNCFLPNLGGGSMYNLPNAYGWTTWAGAIYELYLKTKTHPSFVTVFHCPTGYAHQIKSPVLNDHYFIGLTSEGSQSLCYGWGGPQNARSDRMRKPSAIPLIIDVKKGYAWTISGGIDSNVSFVHNKKAQVLFGDFHVDATTSQENKIKITWDPTLLKYYGMK